MRFRRPILLLAGLCLLAASARAQIHTGVLEAIVTDAEGTPLVGVPVRLLRPDTGLERLISTEMIGLARFEALPPGRYEIRLEPQGAPPIVREAVLRVGQTIRLQLGLQVDERLEVTATPPLVDLHKLDSSTNILPEQIDRLPVADRDYQGLAFIAPGVQRERGEFRFIQGGPVIGAGGNASLSTILVDGVDFTDPALGLARTSFSQEAIQEFRVLGQRFDSEVGGSAGGGLSIVTRSGANERKGRVFAFLRDDSLRQRAADEDEDLPFSRYQYGFSLGGPIRADRSHFFVASERVDEDDIAPFRPRGAFAELAADIAQPTVQDLIFVSLDHRPGASQTLSGKLVYERFRQDNFRVGGVADESYGQELNRDNWNLTALHLLVIGSDSLNELRAQVGRREFHEPPNSVRTTEWFSSGTTLQTGTNIVGDLLGEGEVAELRNTYHLRRRNHRLKFGGSIEHIEDRSRIPAFQEGIFTYLTDSRLLPIAYAFGVGSSDVTHSTTRYGVFVHDDWRPRSDLSVGLGIRYDLDTRGNNAGFTHPLVPRPRPRDEDNFQPRFGFSWDLGGGGRNVVRGGIGLFTGRFLLVPTGLELQQNGVSGWTIRRNVNGLLLGLPPPFWLDPTNPENTGIPLPPDITLIDSELEAPSSVQATLGWTHRLFGSALFLDLEAIYVDGDDEIIIRDKNFGGNENPVRPIPFYSQVNTHTNEGRSEYKALVARLHGTLSGGHLLAVSATLADKKNISDDFSPAFPFGFPSDPADIGAEWGRARSDEAIHLVASGVFILPWDLTLAPILEYGDGLPWTRRIGYDFNSDGKNSDRRPGVPRNGEEGPEFRQLSLRITKRISLAGRGHLELIAEAFNLLNETNPDVGSVDGAELLSGPTLANPLQPVVPNPNFGRFSANLPKREIQLGVRWSF